jgi:hypothetical protein
MAVLLLLLLLLLFLELMVLAAVMTRWIDLLVYCPVVAAPGRLWLHQQHQQQEALLHQQHQYQAD